MKIKRVLFVIVIAFQFLVTGSIIYRHEQILKEGKRFLFKTAPVDPYDAFRGRYVSLAMEQETLTFDFNPNRDDYSRKQDIYAVIGIDSEGFAVIEELLLNPPQGKDYLKVKYLWAFPNPKKGYQVRIQMPFKRFYMNEKIAPQAEKVYRQRNRREASEDAYVSVRIKNGLGVIENLFIGDKPIQEMLEL